jgi:hypothetical protein
MDQLSIIQNKSSNIAYFSGSLHSMIVTSSLVLHRAVMEYLPLEAAEIYMQNTMHCLVVSYSDDTYNHSCKCYMLLVVLEC